jgi:O-antigen ligase
MMRSTLHAICDRRLQIKNLEFDNSIATSFWVIVGAGLLAFGWILPNHYWPWVAFHSDAWIAVILAIMSAFIIFRSKTKFIWHWTTLLVAGMAGIPFLQHAFGLVAYAGQAWVSSLYLLGLLLVLLIGAHWERTNPKQLADILFLAFGIASLASFGLQLFQWLGMDGFEYASMGLAGGRPYANLGQPNQLGTLLLWGLLACAWGMVTKKIGPSIALLSACLLLFGIALTQSRAAWLGLALLFIATWHWRQLWPTRKTPWIITGLVIYFIVCNAAVPWITESLGVISLERSGERVKSLDSRLIAWRLFADAIMQRPFFGYGWAPVTSAHLDVALDHPSLHVLFGHAHNLFIDLILWCGLPIGIAAALGLCYWFFHSLKRISNINDAILLMVVAVVGNHAMFELPLHYAYFLLPTGLVVVILNFRLHQRFFATTPSAFVFVIWFCSVLPLAFLIHDYFKIEENFQALRFERARIGSRPAAEAPKVLILTHLHDELKFARMEPKGKLTAAELEWVRSAALARPSTFDLYKLATILAMNNQPGEALLWLRKLCRITSPDQCEAVKRLWESEGLQNPRIASVRWKEN